MCCSYRVCGTLTAICFVVHVQYISACNHVCALNYASGYCLIVVANLREPLACMYHEDALTLPFTSK